MASRAKSWDQRRGSRLIRYRVMRQGYKLHQAEQIKRAEMTERRTEQEVALQARIRARRQQHRERDAEHAKAKQQTKRARFREVMRAARARHAEEAAARKAEKNLIVDGTKSANGSDSDMNEAELA